MKIVTRSTKYDYRVVTAPSDSYTVERTTISGSGWSRASLDCSNKFDAIMELMRLVQSDDFIPQVVEI